MKNIIKWALPIYLILSLSSCKDDETIISIGDVVNLTTEISTQSAVMGDDIVFAVKINQDNDSLYMNEDVAVRLTFSGQDKDGNAVSAEDVFTGFTETLALHKGEKQAFAEFKVREDLTHYPINGKITAFVRGYQMSNAERTIVISDKHYTMMSLMNNADLTVNEYGKIILVATVGAEAKEPVTVNIVAEDPTKFTNLPSSITVPAGFMTAQSEVITVAGQEGDNDFSSLKLSFSTTSEKHPLYSEEMVITVNDLDKGLDATKKLVDERWVYPNANQVFVSSKNKSAVLAWSPIVDFMEIQVGDDHPNANLAGQGWKFMNSMEFHPIDALTAGGKINEWNNRVPRFMGEQNVAGTQEYQAVANEKYSHINSSGYLQMWSAYEPDGLNAEIWNGTLGIKKYGVSAMYANKFDGNPSGGDSWENSNVRILPGTRVEIRARIRGNKKTFNPALWLQGNKYNVDTWPKYGEVDILENPSKTNDTKAAYQTFHWGDGKHFNPGAAFDITVSDFNIYWFEWLSNDELVMGINGAETVRIKKDGTYSKAEINGYNNYGSKGSASWTTSDHWPFSQDYNPEGMHLLLTFATGADWAMPGGGGTADDKIFAVMQSLPYNGNELDGTDYPRMEIDWIRYYTKSNYNYLGNGGATRNTPMY